MEFLGRMASWGSSDCGMCASYIPSGFKFLKVPLLLVVVFSFRPLVPHLHIRREVVGRSLKESEYD